MFVFAADTEEEQILWIETLLRVKHALETEKKKEAADIGENLQQSIVIAPLSVRKKGIFPTSTSCWKKLNSRYFPFEF